jgi:hypothetical protein
LTGARYPSNIGSISGSISENDCKLQFVIEAVGKGCWHFAFWKDIYGDTISINNPFSGIMNSDTTIIAVFEKELFNYRIVSL